MWNDPYRYGLLLLLIFGNIGHLSGQNDSEPSLESFRKIEQMGIISGYRNLNDQAISRQLYRGVGIGFTHGGMAFRNNHVKYYYSDVSFNFLSSKNDLSVSDIWYTATYGHWRKVGKPKKHVHYLGLQADISSQVQIIPELNNSHLNWNLLAGVGLGYFQILPSKRQRRTYVNFYLPLVNYVNRPKFGVVIDASQPQKHQLVLIGGSVRMVSELGLLGWRQNQPKPWGRVFYRWTFHYWEDHLDHQVIFGYHQIGLLFNITVKPHAR